MPHKHYFMIPTSLTAFPSAQPGSFFAHVTELFGKAQTRANRCTICPLSYKEKHGVGKVLAFPLMLKLKGQHLEYQSWPFAWPPVQFTFLWNAAKPKVNQQGFVKSNRRTRERTWWTHAMKTIKLRLCWVKDSQIKSFPFYWPPNVFKTGRLKSPIKVLKWQTLSKPCLFLHFSGANEKLGSLSCHLLVGGSYGSCLTLEKRVFLLDSTVGALHTSVWPPILQQMTALTCSDLPLFKALRRLLAIFSCYKTDSGLIRKQAVDSAPG